jgi:single-stranded-DNA-specific exonuclease
MNAQLQQATRWIVKDRDINTEQQLCHELEISPLLAAILANRGITSKETAHHFLRPTLDDLHSPSLLPDYDSAIEIILKAKNNNDLIFVHGDYDVDGVSSTALLTRFFKSIGCKVESHVPHRTREGYGIHPDAVKKAHQLDAKLFITCDCGTKSFDQIKLVKELGMSCIVTDHHEIGDTLPPADAIINPHRSDSKYPFKELSGAGVAFKLCEGITHELGIPKHQYYRAFLDLVTLGTVADVVSLSGENRVLVKFGLEQLQNTKKEGLRALLEVSNGPNFKDSLQAWHIGFRLGPRLNAVGRLEEATSALNLLLESDPSLARELALKLDEANQNRRIEQQQSFEEAMDLVLSQNLHEQPTLIVASENWHPGIIGLVASKLTERFHRPSFVIAADREKGIGKGSARSIPGFHLAQSLQKHEHLFLSSGGHEKAAGFSIELDKLDEMRSAMSQHAHNIMKPEDFIPSITIDAEITAAEANFQATQELSLLEPFGESNSEPIFLTRNLEIVSVDPTTTGEHCRVVLRDDEGEIRRAMAFGMGNRLTRQDSGKKADLVYTSGINTFNGKSSLQWQIKDYKIL